MEGKAKRQRVRTVRYTLLLTPSEFDLATKLAKQEFRTLPDFFRMRIYKGTTAPELNERPKDRATEQCAGASA